MNIETTDDDRINFERLVQHFLADELSEAEADEFLRRLRSRPGFAGRVESHLEMDFLMRFLGGMKNDRIVSALQLSEADRNSKVRPALQKLWDRYSDVLNSGKGDKSPPVSSVPFEPVDWNRLARLSSEAAEGTIGPEKLQEFSRLALQAASVTTLKQPSVSDREPVAKPPVRAYRPESREPRALHVVLVLLVCTFGFLAVYSEFFHVGPGETDPVPVPFHSVATVSAAVDVEWPEGTEPIKKGRHLEPGRIAFHSGLLELQLSNDVRLALEGPVDFQLNSERNAFCNRGRLSATVPKTGKGFEIVTPLLNVIDLGTEFSLLVEEESVETHTLTGKVELTRMPGGKVELGEGNAIRSDPRGKIARFNADPLTFLSGRAVARKAAEADKMLLDRWRTRQESWNADPSLKVHFDFEDDDTVVRNSSLAGRSGPNGILQGASRSTGRWRGKGAVEFRRKRDSVPFELTQSFSSLTLFVSVRIDTLSRFNQTLLASRTPHKGSIVWQIWDDGSLQLSVAETPGKPPLRFNAPKLIPRWRWGAWYTICTVFDGEAGTVAHYFEGEKVGTLPLEHPLSVRPGTVTLGNAFLDKKNTTDRSLDGGIDQFMLFDRALSAGEVARLHHSSNLEKEKKP